MKSQLSWPGKQEWPHNEALTPDTIDLIRERLQYLVQHDAQTAVLWRSVRGITGMTDTNAVHIMFTFLFAGEKTYKHVRDKLKGSTELSEGIDAFLLAHTREENTRMDYVFRTQYMQCPNIIDIPPTDKE